VIFGHYPEVTPAPRPRVDIPRSGVTAGLRT
jgi:hypothetical protein